MNRRVATNQKSEIGDTSGLDDGDVAVRADASGDKSTRQKKQSGGKDAPRKSGKGKDGESGNVGNLLRGAYRQAVDEAIPDDLMDLLNKLE